MTPQLLALPWAFGTINDFWYAIPLILAVSLVYSGTRHERMPTILVGATRFAIWVSAFFVGTFLLLNWITHPL